MSYFSKRRARIKEPFFTKSKRDCHCAESGEVILTGEWIAFYPSTGKSYKEKTKQAGELRDQDFSAANGMGDSNY